MSLRCKVGDLCVVVRDEEFPENVGAFLTILGKPDPLLFGVTCLPAGADWDCRPRAPIWGQNPNGKRYLDKRDVIFSDACLKPIRPEQAQKSTTTSIPTPSPVVPAGAGVLTPEKVG